MPGTRPDGVATKLLRELSPTARELYHIMERAPNRCPVCSLSRAAVERFIDAQSNTVDSPVPESVNGDSGKPRLGFCASHAHIVLARRQGLVPALMYRDVLTELRSVVSAFDTLKPAPRSSRQHERRREVVRARKDVVESVQCAACRCMHDAETAGVQAVVEGMDSPHFRARYVHTQGLCLPHFQMTHAVCRDVNAWRIIYDTELAGVDELKDELNELIRKQDYRFSHERIGAEADSCRRAVERVRGRLH